LQNVIVSVKSIPITYHLPILFLLISLSLHISFFLRFCSYLPSASYSHDAHSLYIFRLVINQYSQYSISAAMHFIKFDEISSDKAVIPLFLSALPTLHSISLHPSATFCFLPHFSRSLLHQSVVTCLLSSQSLFIS